MVLTPHCFCGVTPRAGGADYSAVPTSLLRYFLPERFRAQQLKSIYSPQ